MVTGQSESSSNPSTSLPRASYRSYHLRDIHRDIKNWMCFVPYAPIPGDQRAEFFEKKITIPPYILPDGTSITLSEGLCSAPEKVYFLDKRYSDKPWTSLVAYNQSIFGLPGFSQPMALGHGPQGSAEANATLTAIVHACVSRADVDIRKDLLAGMVVVGGSSLIDGVSQRLTYELGEMLTSPHKVRNTYR